MIIKKFNVQVLEDKNKNNQYIKEIIIYSVFLILIFLSFIKDF
jgi:hypothetical protein